MRGQQDSRAKSLFRLGLLSLMLLVLFFLAWSGISAEILDAERVRHWVSDFGIWAPLVYVSAFFLIILVLLPPTLMTLTAGFLFGPYAGLLISMACVNLGGICIFLVARYLGQEGVRRFLPGRLSQLDEKLTHRGLLTVILLRLTFVPFGIVSLSAGVSSIRKRDFLLGTLVGTFPATFMITWIGDIILEVWKSRDFSPLFGYQGLFCLLLFALAFAFPFIWKREKNH